MQDAKLFRSLDRTIFLPVTASVFAIVLFSFMLMAERPGFGRSNLPAVHNPLWMPAASDEDAEVLTLLQDGRVFWGRDPTLVGELKPKLIHLLQHRPYSPVYLAVDANTTYRNLSNVLAAVRSANLTKIVFLVEQRKNWTALVEDSQPRFWDAAHRWESTDWLLRADFMLLLFMLVNTGAILILSLYRYRYAARQVRAFIREIASALHEGKLRNVIAIDAEIDRRHFASGIGDSVRAYASTPPHFSHREAVEFAQRAYRRRSKWVTASLEEGLGTLSMITSSATFIGFLGTVYGIVHTFRGTSGSKAAALSRIAAELAIAVLLGAMGLLASVLALWCLNYLRRRLEVVQGRVSNAYLDVVERLNAHPEWRELLRELFVAERSIPSDFATRGWEASYDRQRPLAIAMWVCVLYVAYVMAHDVYWSWLLR